MMISRTRAMPEPLSDIRGVATGWTGVDMSTPLLPGIDANPVSFYSRGGGIGVSQLTGV